VSDVLAWCFHSPRRLGAVALVLLALVVGAGAAVRALIPAEGAPAPARPASTAAVAGTGGAVDAALAFTRAWASKPASASAEQWQRTLQPLVTPDLGRQLAYTDPAALPGGTPVGQPGIRFQEVQSALLEVRLSTGRTVLVTVVRSGDRWLASDVQPLAGDLGDVPSAAPAGPASRNG